MKTNLNNCVNIGFGEDWNNMFAITRSVVDLEMEELNKIIFKDMEVDHRRKRDIIMSLKEEISKAFEKSTIVDGT